MPIDPLGIDLMEIIILAMGLSFLGMFSKYKIFLLVAVGPIFHLAYEYMESTDNPANQIIATCLAGWMVFNIYLAFNGGNDE